MISFQNILNNNQVKASGKKPFIRHSGLSQCIQVWKENRNKQQITPLLVHATHLQQHRCAGRIISSEAITALCKQVGNRGCALTG